MQMRMSGRNGLWLAATCTLALTLSALADPAQAQGMRREAFKVPTTGTLQHPGHGRGKLDGVRGTTTGTLIAPRPPVVRDHRQPGSGCNGSDASNASGGVCVKSRPRLGPLCAAPSWLPEWAG